MRDTSEFDEFYLASAERVVSHLCMVTGSRTEAEDAVAEAYMRAWQRWQTVREADSPEAWVRRVSSQIAVSSWRKTVNRLRAHRRAAVDTGIPGLSADRVAVMRALQALSANQRRAIVLYHLADLSVAEIAAEMGAPAGTIKAHLARGRKVMADLLSDTAYGSVETHG